MSVERGDGGVLKDRSDGEGEGERPLATVDVISEVLGSRGGVRSGGGVGGGVESEEDGESEGARVGLLYEGSEDSDSSRESLIRRVVAASAAVHADAHGPPGLVPAPTSLPPLPARQTVVSPSTTSSSHASLSDVIAATERILRGIASPGESDGESFEVGDREEERTGQRDEMRVLGEVKGVTVQVVGRGSGERGRSVERQHVSYPHTASSTSSSSSSTRSSYSSQSRHNYSTSTYTESEDGGDRDESEEEMEEGEEKSAAASLQRIEDALNRLSAQLSPTNQPSSSSSSTSTSTASPTPSPSLPSRTSTASHLRHHQLQAQDDVSEDEESEDGGGEGEERSEEGESEGGMMEEGDEEGGEVGGGRDEVVEFVRSEREEEERGEGEEMGRRSGLTKEDKKLLEDAASKMERLLKSKAKLRHQLARERKQRATMERAMVMLSEQLAAGEREWRLQERALRRELMGTRELLRKTELALVHQPTTISKHSHSTTPQPPPESPSPTTSSPSTPPPVPVNVISPPVYSTFPPAPYWT